MESLVGEVSSFETVLDKHLYLNCDVTLAEFLVCVMTYAKRHKLTRAGTIKLIALIRPLLPANTITKFPKTWRKIDKCLEPFYNKPVINSLVLTILSRLEKNLVLKWSSFVWQITNRYSRINIPQIELNKEETRTLAFHTGSLPQQVEPRQSIATEFDIHSGWLFINGHKDITIPFSNITDAGNISRGIPPNFCLVLQKTEYPRNCWI